MTKYRVALLFAMLMLPSVIISADGTDNSNSLGK